MNRQPICMESKWCVTAQAIICIPWNIDFTTCADIRMQHDFHTSAVGTTLALLHEPPTSKRRRKRCPMTREPLSCLGVKLIETNGLDSWKKREQKVTFPFQIRASAFFAARFSGLKNYRIARFPISPTTVGPDCCWRLQQLPQGCQSSLRFKLMEQPQLQVSKDNYRVSESNSTKGAIR